MSFEYLRTFRKYSLDEIRAQLLILGDLNADCGACRALGIDPADPSKCPECGTRFRYVTSRRMESSPGERFRIVKRFLDRNPDFEFIDYSDYQTLTGKKKARDFFG